MRQASLALFLCLVSPVAFSGKETKKKPATYTIPLPPKPDYTAFGWLAGEWMGKTTGKSPEGSIHLSVSADLEGRFMVFREEVSFGETKTAPATTELWLGILGVDGQNGTYRLRSFSSTGFVYQYQVTADGPEIRFTPQGGDQTPPGWLFRRALERTSDDEVAETVQVAPPAGSFFDYYTAALRRIAPPEKKSSDLSSPNSKQEVK